MIKTKDGDFELHGSLVTSLADFTVICLGMKKTILSSFGEDSPFPLPPRACEAMSRDLLKRCVERAYMGEAELEESLENLASEIKEVFVNTDTMCKNGGGDISHG